MENEKKRNNGPRKILLTGFVVVLCAGFLGVGIARAQVERMAVQTPARQAEQRLAKQNLKNVDLQKIEDPEARKAIQEILRYLNVQNKKKN
ncbi:MAG: hypothetical protein V1882_09760 [Candidatus Omnitrophota bacterium]